MSVKIETKCIHLEENRQKKKMPVKHYITVQ